jgi:AraC-like DNA-binding protein
MYALGDQGIIMPRGIPLHGGKASCAPPDAAVIALVLGPAERARVRSALRARYDVRFVDRAFELSQAVLSPITQVACVIVEVRDVDGRTTAEAVAQLCDKGNVPVIAYCRTGAEHTSELRALIVAGVHELLYEGVDDAGLSLRAVLQAAHRAQVGQRVASALTARLPERLRSFARHVAAHPDVHRVSDLADALGYNRKTLVNHCAEGGCPPPQELMAWCRLAVVAELLTTTTQTIEAIALELDFASDTALRNMIKRYTGLRASEVRAHGGMECVLEAFEAAMRMRRQGVAEAAS